MKIVALVLLFALAAQARRPSARSINPLNTPTNTAGRIIGGQEAERGQFPHQAAILIDATDVCGGSLISLEWVLTAGHCVHNAQSWDVTLGQQQRSAVEDGRITVRTTEAHLHPNYNSLLLSSDIALIKLPSPVAVSQYIDVVTLPTRADVGNLFVGTAVIVSGWGMADDAINTVNDQLKYANLGVVANKDCTDAYGFIVTGSNLCATAGAGNACHGDSGGPMILASDGVRPKQIGIISFVSSKGCSRGPSGYTRVTSHLDFIQDTTGIQIQP